MFAKEMLKARFILMKHYSINDWNLFINKLLILMGLLIIILFSFSFAIAGILLQSCTTGLAGLFLRFSLFFLSLYIIPVLSKIIIVFITQK